MTEKTTVQNREELATTPARDLALDCVEAGVDAAHPRQVVRASVSLDGDRLTVEDATYDLSEYEDVLIVGGGKATGTVAAVLADVLCDRLTGGAIVTTDPVSIPGVETFEGGHPVPNEEGVAGARRVLELADAAGEETLLLAVITGGGSALMTAPAEGVGLADVRAVTDAMLDAGMEIHDINAVRKHVSAIKGGNLARRAAPASVPTLVFSDVVGNDLSVIASGPTVPDDATYADAVDALDRHGVDAPAAVRSHLEAGVASEIPETPDVSHPAFERVDTHVLADGMTALVAARDVADAAGYRTLTLSSRLRGEAREAAKVHAGVAEECHATGTPVEPPVVVLSGGELTVTVRGEGSGGPSTEFALASALELDEAGTTVAAVDTDGIDGHADAAGGLVDADTVSDAGEARAALDASDAGTYLREHAGAVMTGATGTNVNDLRVVVLDSE
ncbi:MAG: glycerate kinase [Halobacteriales archaeon SW_9_67_25]|nr:MAG: glycerate kinase [Halobacteriales archaeon SW_9_67_25]